MTLRESLADRRIWIMAVYGFACGLPLMLSAFTLRQWMTEAGVSIQSIGLSAFIGLSYSLKFLWAPLLDRVRPPFFALGRRRGWLAAIQPLLSGACILFALSDPAHGPIGTVAAAVCVAFLSASQDIVVDAWRIETFPTEMQGVANAVYVWGYRFAMLISGSGAIALAGPIGWHGSLLVVAAITTLPLLVTVLAPTRPDPPLADRRGGSIIARFIAPLQEFMQRPGAWMVVAFVALYRLGEAMAGVMLPPLYRSLGFDRAVVAVASTPISLPATLAGISIGGWLVSRLGVGRTLLLTGAGQTIAMFMYVALAASAGDQRVLYSTSFVEALAGGLADAAFITYLSGLCSVSFTATQYALLTSLAAVASHTVGGLSGFLVAQIGWAPFYLFTAFATMPSMMLMVLLLRRYPPAPTITRQPENLTEDMVI